MLVLSRRKNETLVIGDNIRVTVVEIRGDKVRLAVSADRDVPVHREEVYAAIQREKQESIKTYLCRDCNVRMKSSFPDVPCCPLCDEKGVLLYGSQEITID